MIPSCRPFVEAGTDLWFSTSPADRAQARAICGGCPLIEACDRAATGEVWGTWAGRDREPEPPRMVNPPARLRQRVRGLAAHGTDARYQTCREGDDGRACRDCLAAHARHVADWRKKPAVTAPTTLVVDQLNLFEETA